MSAKTEQQPNKASKPLTNFTKSFKPIVELPRGGDACKLHRHYRHFLRQIVSRLDYMAGLDLTGERFVFAGVQNFIQHCKNFETGKRPSERMVLACFRQLRMQGVYRVEKKVRMGVERAGKTVAKHDDLTKIMNAKYCVFSGPTSPSTSPPTSPQSEKHFISDFTSDFTSDSDEVQACQQIEGVDESFVRRNAESFSDANSFSSLNMNKTSMNESSADSLVKAELNKVFPARQRLVKDGITGNSLERMVDIISDGLFQTAALNYYSYTEQLIKACNQAVVRFGQEPFSDRKMCHTLMQRVMDDLNKQKIKAPSGWVPVLKQLLATQKESLHILPDAVDAFESGSSLNYYEDLVKQTELINRAAHEFGVPSSWAESVEFLRKVIKRMQQHSMVVPTELTDALNYFKARADEVLMTV